jgi:hypothetical protein
VPADDFYSVIMIRMLSGVVVGAGVAGVEQRNAFSQKVSKRNTAIRFFALFNVNLIPCAGAARDRHHVVGQGWRINI